ncbi:MAG TPA: hypothetical protein VD772_01470 [Anseongella sp.]|nr:hypothetical protein [Anseongella sp.]
MKKKLTLLLFLGFAFVGSQLLAGCNPPAGEKAEEQGRTMGGLHIFRK